MTPSTALMSSPLGMIELIANHESLIAVRLCGAGDRPLTATAPTTPVLERASTQLVEYFAGTRVAFDVPLNPEGTSFQRQVWEQLLAIPHGEIRSYGHIAKSIGRPAASRAVGAANARNPIAIIVPCHRVIGANGTLTGYAHGLAAKQWLLDHERVQQRSK